MNKLYCIVVILVCAIGLWVTEKALSQSTIIIQPDGTIMQCIETVSGVVTCI